MTTNNKETTLAIKRTNSRYIMIRENIHDALDIYSLALYMTFRYEADYTQEDSSIKRSAKFIYQKAKISRVQYYRCLNKLEKFGLVMRDKKNQLGDTCVYHVAQELNYFNETGGGVSDRDRGVPDRDTDHYSFSLNNTNSESDDSPTTATKEKNKKLATDELLRELIDVYRDEFPDNPQPHKTLIATSLRKTMRTLVKQWPEADPQKRPLTPDIFRQYMKALKTLAPKFSLNAYTTQDGNRKKNNLETFCRWNTLVKFLENQYS